MKCLSRLLAAAMLAAIVAGCAGTSFTRVPDDQLILNRTSEQEIVGRLGKPSAVGVRTENGEQVRTIAYSYASSVDGLSLISGVPSSHSQAFSFHNDKLVAYQYSSNRIDSSTNFDGNRVAQFKEGVTTRREVIESLGAPTGQSVFPVVEGRSDRGLSYSYSFLDTRKYNMALESKRLTVVVDENDVVKKVIYTTAGGS